MSRSAPAFGALLLLMCTLPVRLHAAAPPASVVAVANRDAEGAIVLDADVSRNYQPTGTACRDSCLNTTGCNVWVWCGAVSGCAQAGSYTRDPSKFQQCWLKSDNVPKVGQFPRSKNSPDQATGWMSGTTAPGVNDAAPSPEQAYSCTCQADYTASGFRFKGVCAQNEGWGLSCPVDSSSCKDGTDSGLRGCPTMQPCTVLLDTDLQEDKVLRRPVLVSGDNNSADSAEDCCSQCASAQGCTIWTWCADPTGCDGERYRFRQCWLKQADPNNPQPKKGYGGSRGWISGVRLAWLPL
ncbi:hypothetical protein VOLCADRAFT_94935 [Volvox carteri f. nagariensis]|uniref:Apple domain-containing protein n=1 Tax=Volvox carteri f. nagariensis TaxID=3068 RepID=D8U661_VOLCA|nr:uncharacterized protein VOLCADRAFT_94935 [Volvox carteri f. nagariensis]EFJ44797.1 hypothetical protein VOLCADRAFT_94935 [Volvox carteri f. nagariensis]|eukprot:XP_002954080.1 hypothetical protein VOLCADRAFT_94935 [Volvox carteri f. nagariensis]